jgi:hypothetical protein
MLRSKARVTVILMFAVLAFSACAKVGGGDESRAEPATVEKIDGSDLNRLVLQQEAATRLGIETAPVREAARPPTGNEQRAVDYSAVIYDADGQAAVYTNPAPLTYVRAPITVDDIEGDLAFVTEGPPVGTPVVTVGAAELFGIDAGVGGNE